MKKFAPIFLLLFFVAQPAISDCKRNATVEQIETSKAKALSEPDAQSVLEEDYLKVSFKNEKGAYFLYFTEPQHPAHPAYVVTVIYEKEGEILMYSRGRTAGDCKIFQQWMKSFEAQHKRVQDRMRQPSH